MKVTEITQHSTTTENFAWANFLDSRFDFNCLMAHRVLAAPIVIDFVVSLSRCFAIIFAYYFYCSRISNGAMQINLNQTPRVLFVLQISTENSEKNRRRINKIDWWCTDDCGKYFLLPSSARLRTKRLHDQGFSQPIRKHAENCNNNSQAEPNRRSR